MKTTFKQAESELKEISEKYHLKLNRYRDFKKAVKIWKESKIVSPQIKGLLMEIECICSFKNDLRKQYLN